MSRCHPRASTICIQAGVLQEGPLGRADVGLELTGGMSISSRPMSWMMKVDTACKMPESTVAQDGVVVTKMRAWKRCAPRQALGCPGYRYGPESRPPMYTASALMVTASMPMSASLGRVTELASQHGPRIIPAAGPHTRLRDGPLPSKLPTLRELDDLVVI